MDERADSGGTPRDGTPRDIVAGVGVTALGVAATRALETGRADALVRDPYAAAFVTAARPHVAEPMPVTRAELDELFPPASLPATEAGIAKAWWPVMAEYTGVRTRFFDEYVVDACASGVRQVVLVAAGLDTRAYRLAWPEGTVVYELDRPGVLAFKDGVLADEDLAPTCDRRTVPADLERPWSDALTAAGLDPSRPVAWLAEGLLPYLTEAAQADLFATVDALSPPRSRLAAEDVDAGLGEIATAPSPTSAPGFGEDIATLFPGGDRPTPARRLASAGWQVQSRDAPDVADHYGRRLTGAPRQVVAHCTLLTARRP